MKRLALSFALLWNLTVVFCTPARTFYSPYLFLDTSPEISAAIDANIEAAIFKYQDARTSDALSKPWLGKENKLTPEHLEEILSWIATDPEGKKLLSDAMKRVRANDLKSLISYIQPDSLTESLKGRKGYSSYDYWFGDQYKIDVENVIQFSESAAFSEEQTLTDEEFNALYAPKLKTKSEHRVSSGRSIRDYFLVRPGLDFSLGVYVGPPSQPSGSGETMYSIVIDPRESLGGALTKLSHELYHFAYRTNIELLTLIDSPSKAEAAIAYILAKGGEASALIFEYGINARQSTPWADLQGFNLIDGLYFNKSGSFVGDPRSFALFLLDGIGDSSYRKDFEEKYASYLQDASEKEKSAIKSIQKQIDSLQFKLSQLEAQQIVEDAESSMIESKESDIPKSLSDSKKKVQAVRAAIVRLNKLMSEYNERQKKFESILQEKIVPLERKNENADQSLDGKN